MMDADAAECGVQTSQLLEAKEQKLAEAQSRLAQAQTRVEAAKAAAAEAWAVIE